ncbi:MAG: UPF0158 family protein [candidate division WOR-3 bacterium]
MRKLRVSERDLLFALTNQMQETAHYLNLETGEVIPVFSFNRDEILKLIRQHPDRYLRLAPQSSRESQEMLKGFIRTISRQSLKTQLLSALQEKRVFARFREVLARFPNELKRWHSYRIMILTEPLRRKLREKGVELVLIPDRDEKHDYQELDDPTGE